MAIATRSGTPIANLLVIEYTVCEAEGRGRSSSSLLCPLHSDYGSCEKILKNCSVGGCSVPSVTCLHAWTVADGAENENDDRHPGGPHQARQGQYSRGRVEVLRRPLGYSTWPTPKPKMKCWSSYEGSVARAAKPAPRSTTPRRSANEPRIPAEVALVRKT